MSLAVNFKNEEWWSALEHANDDLVAFLLDEEGIEASEELRPLVAANDNFLSGVRATGTDGEVLSSAWSPRFRNAD